MYVYIYIHICKYMHSTKGLLVQWNILLPIFYYHTLIFEFFSRQRVAGGSVMHLVCACGECVWCERVGCACGMCACGVCARLTPITPPFPVHLKEHTFHQQSHIFYPICRPASNEQFPGIITIPWHVNLYFLLPVHHVYEVATISRLLQIIGLFCKRAL